MRDGRCKWFDDRKGFGFIRPSPDDPGIPDALVHYSVIEMPGRKTLAEGQPVTYEQASGKQGLIAVRVWPA